MGSGGPSIENVILAADKTRAKTPKLMGHLLFPELWLVQLLQRLQFHGQRSKLYYEFCLCYKWTLYRKLNGTNTIWKTGYYVFRWKRRVALAMTAMFDAMTALSSKYNETQKKHQELTIKQEMDLLLQVVVEF